jgi:hypothetical protein
MLPENTHAVDRIELLKLLYPWYKEEVYRRRQQMIMLTVMGTVVLLLLLFLIPALPPPRPTHRMWSTFAAVGVILYSAGMMYFILQQRMRHRMAKRVLIVIEQELGLYEEGRYVDGETLYPDHWQYTWLHDRSPILYVGILIALTGLLLIALLTR